MSRSISSCQNFEAITSACEAIGQQGIKEVDAIYGSGYPQWTSVEKPLAYHNGHHARTVGNASARVALAAGLDPVYVMVAEMAGYWHDRVQLKGSGINERESVERLSREMDRTNLFPASLREVAALAILGTEPLFDEQFRIVGQKAEELEYSSRDIELASKSVACADFGELYTPLGPLLGHKLCEEIGKASTQESLIGFQQDQLYLLENYRYPLAEGSQLATHRGEVIAHAHRMFGQLVSGQIEDVDQLFAEDVKFLERMS